MNNKTILITGGTGSFGSKFVETVLKKYPKLKKVVIFSRDELKQHEMAKKDFFKKHENKIRFLIGDIRDLDRLNWALQDINIVIHAAALKQVPAAEYNPFEFIKTNILGTENLISASLRNQVEKFISLSTDKAASPVNLYGATKLCADKLVVNAQNTVGKKNIKFSVVRYGNVANSRGSVIPVFKEQIKNKTLTITSKEMTRFMITKEQGVNFVLKTLDKMWGGEIFVPKLPSVKILDLARFIGPSSKIKIIGIRPGEKLHEEMITKEDSINTLEFKDYYVIIPSKPFWNKKNYLRKNKNFKYVKEKFSYNSKDNTLWLNKKNLNYFINAK